MIGRLAGIIKRLRKGAIWSTAGVSGVSARSMKRAVISLLNGSGWVRPVVRLIAPTPERTLTEQSGLSLPESRRQQPVSLARGSLPLLAVMLAFVRTPAVRNTTGLKAPHVTDDSLQLNPAEVNYL